MADAQVRALMALARAKSLAFAEPTYDQQPQHRTHGDILPVLAAWFGSRAAIAAAQLPEELLTELASVGIGRKAAEEAGRITLQHPLSGRSAYGSPASGDTVTQRVASEEPDMRARFLLTSAERLNEALGVGDYDKAVTNEERYAEQHVAAGQNRRRAAKKLDDLAQTTRFCVWRTAGDSRVTPDCAALAGRIFPASDPPGIPGAMHPACRCYAEAWDGPPLRT